MKRRLVLAAGAAALSTPAWVGAQSAWPSRGPVRLVAQFPPGGLVDTVARLMAPHLSQAIGQTVVVENRPGAGGLIGTDYVAKQPADGYVAAGQPRLGAHLRRGHAQHHALRPGGRLHPHGDAGGGADGAAGARPSRRYQSLGQYVTTAKTKPVRYGTSGVGSANHLFGELLKIEGQAPEHDHVPYQGSAPAMQDLLGGQIDGLFDPITTNVAQLKAGSLRALAVSTPARLPALPSIPTFAELGYPSMTGSQWLGLSAPKGLPAPIAQRLTALMPEILAKPDVMARLEDLQTLPRKTPVLGDDFATLIRSQIDTWTKVARRAKVEVIV